MLTVIQGLRGGALQTTHPPGTHSYAITANPPPGNPPTNRWPLICLYTAEFFFFSLSLSDGRTRCPNNQTLAMSADPSPRLIVLVLLYRLHVVSPPFVFYLSSSSPSLSLRLLTENTTQLIYLPAAGVAECYHEFHVESDFLHV